VGDGYRPSLRAEYYGALFHLFAIINSATEYPNILNISLLLSKLEFAYSTVAPDEFHAITFCDPIKKDGVIAKILDEERSLDAIHTLGLTGIQHTEISD